MLESGFVMLTRREHESNRRRAVQFLRRAGIFLREDERKAIEVADFGQGARSLANLGAEILTYFNTEGVSAKEVVLFPRQTTPEHRHPPIGSYPGKEETFRCRWGTVYLYVPGEKTAKPHAMVPKGREKWFTVHHEVVLKRGGQYTVAPDTLHWCQAGDKGAVFSEFTTKNVDEEDVFTDPTLVRATKIL